MKFSWKVFCGVAAILCVSFSLGGALLISVWFQSALDREIQFAQEENRLLRFSLQTAVSALPVYPESDVKQLVTDVVQSILPPTQQSRSPVRIAYSQGQTLYDGPLSASPDLSRLLTEENEGETGGYLIVEEDGRFLIRYISTGRLYGQDVFVESQRDVSAVFQQRQDQFALYARLTILLLLLGGGAALLLARWLTRPIVRLSAATRRMAQGDYAVRAPETRRDETGELARDFNAMADNLELTISQLRQAVQRQEEFSGSFAHEVKTPLTSIIGYADLLRSRSLPPETQFEAANYIYQEGKRLESLSLKLLDLMVLEKQEFQWKPVPMEAFLQQTAQFAAPSFRQAGVSLQTDVQPGLLSGDADLLKTLCLNLLDNACKAGGAQVVLKGRPVPEGYCVSVLDDGPGAPPEALDKLTEAFYRADPSRSRKQGGAGLGLTICAKIVRLHRGTLSFRREEGVTVAQACLKGGAVCEKENRPHWDSPGQRP